MIGEFEWSLYQRAFDGARSTSTRARWHATASWFRPTQGGFEEQAGRPLRRVQSRPARSASSQARALRHTDWQGFVYRYDDTPDA